MDEMQPRDKETEFANGVAILFAAATFVVGLRQNGVIDFVGIGIAVGTGIAAWGAVRAATILTPNVLNFFLSIPVAPKLENKPDLTAAVPPAPALPVVEDEEGIEAWEIALEAKLYEDRRLRIGSRVVEIPANVEIEHLYQLAEARAKGLVRYLVSPTALDEEVGISRNGREPNAQTLVAFLLDIGAVDFKGDRRPMPWTRVGQELFPSTFSDSPAPAYANGQAAVPTS